MTSLRTAVPFHRLAQHALPLGLLALGLLGGDARAQQAPPARTITLFVGRSERIDSTWPVKGAALTDPSVADVQVLTPQLVLVSGKAPGTTDLLLWGENGQTGDVRIEVNVDLARMSSEMSAMFPGAGLEVSRTQDVTVVSGALSRADQAKQLHDYMEARGLEYVDQTTLAGVQQVQVQVRIAEISRSGLRELGLNILKNGSSFFGGSLIGSSNGGPINPVSVGPPLGSSALGDGTFAFNQAVNISPGVTLFAGFPKADLEYFLQALAENEFLRVLAEPNLVALSGEEASFLAGGEFPIPVVQGGGTSGGTSVTIEYKKFGVSLNFRPIVEGDARIRLQVYAEVSDLSDKGAVEIQGFSVPSLITRKAETTVDMKSGQTFAMAGLLNQAASARTSQIPGLGDLPVLGSLFRSVRYKSGETELLVLVTTSLVEPLSATDLPPMPGQNHRAPDDWELYGKGLLEGAQTADAPPADEHWLKELGLDRLKGPGTWVTHEQAPVPSTAQPAEAAPAKPGN